MASTIKLKKGDEVYVIEKFNCRPRLSLRIQILPFEKLIIMKIDRKEADNEWAGCLGVDYDWLPIDLDCLYKPSKLLELLYK